MSIERRKFVELPGTIKWGSFHADKQDKSSSNLDPSFNFEDVSKSSRPTSSARTFPKTNTLAEPTYTRLRYALRLGHLAFGRHFSLATLARSVGAGIMPAGHALFQLLPADAAHANWRSGVVLRLPMPVEPGEPLNGRLPLEGFGFSVGTPLHLMSGQSGFKGLPEMWALRVALFERGRPCRLAVHVGRIWSCIGQINAFLIVAVGKLRCIASVLERIVGTTRCRNLKRACSCILHEISAGMVSSFNTLADEQSSLPHSRRMPGCPLEKLRNTANPESSTASRRKRTRDCSNGDKAFLLQQFAATTNCFRLKRAPVSASSIVGWPDTAVATV